MIEPPWRTQMWWSRLPHHHVSDAVQFGIFACIALVYFKMCLYRVSKNLFLVRLMSID